MTFNLATILRESTAADPTHVLVHLGEVSLTYSQVDDLSGRVAASLLDLGLEPGDKVAVQLPNIPQFVLAYFGILKAGLTMVPLSPLLTAPEMAYHLDDSDTRLLIGHELFAAAALAGAREAGLETVHLVSGGDLPDGVHRFEELVVCENTGEIHPTDPEDTAVIVYTSGTTGKPKGAELTHFQLYMNCSVAGELFGARPEDVTITVLPLFHVFGLSSVLNVGVRFGLSLVLIPRFDATTVLDAIERYRATIFCGVPTMYIALLQADTAGRDLGSLRAGVSGGASIPGEVIRAFEETFPDVVILEGYGLSETASTTTFNASAEDRRVLSVGKPVWGVEVRVVDDKGEPLPPGEDQIGEVVVRGHNVMKGYYRRPEETADTIVGGWLHTGDLARWDEDGYLYIVDRLKDLVIRGGFNVYPREVEEVLYAHPAVVEAAVVGRPDDRLGEEVVAYVALGADLTASVEELIDFCRQRLAAYKYPREIRMLRELPKGASEKIVKRLLPPW